MEDTEDTEAVPTTEPAPEAYTTEAPTTEAHATETAKQKKSGKVTFIPPDPFYHDFGEPEHLSSHDAQQWIASYLDRSESKPYMHPECFLSTAGIRFAIGLGPKGGPQIYELRRFEAGLRGEVVEKKTAEQMEEQFGEYWRNTGQEHIIAQLYRDEGLEPPPMKKQKLDVEEWMDASDIQAAMDAEYWKGKRPTFESFVTTPERSPDFGPDEQQEALAHLGDEAEKEMAEQYARDAGATHVAIDGPPPEMVEHDRDGNEAYVPQHIKEERKARKKARKEKEKKEKILEAENRRLEDLKLKEKEAEVRTMKAMKGQKDDASEEEDTEEEARKGRRAEKKAKKKEEKRKKHAAVEPHDSHDIVDTVTLGKRKDRKKSFDEELEDSKPAKKHKKRKRESHKDPEDEDEDSKPSKEHKKSKSEIHDNSEDKDGQKRHRQEKKRRKEEKKAKKAAKENG